MAIWKVPRSREPSGCLPSSQLLPSFSVINVPHVFSHPHSYRGNCMVLHDPAPWPQVTHLQGGSWSTWPKPGYYLFCCYRNGMFYSRIPSNYYCFYVNVLFCKCTYFTDFFKQRKLHKFSVTNSLLASKH